MVFNHHFFEKRDGSSLNQRYLSNYFHVCFDVVIQFVGQYSYLFFFIFYLVKMLFLYFFEQKNLLNKITNDFQGLTYYLNLNDS